MIYAHPLARHQTETPFPCNGVLVLSLEQSPFGYFNELVAERCMGCGRVVNVWGVKPEVVEDRKKW